MLGSDFRPGPVKKIVEINCTAHARKDGDQTFRHSDMKLNVEIIQQLEHGGVPVAALEEVVEGVLEALREVFKSGSSAALLKALKNRSVSFSLLLAWLEIET